MASRGFPKYPALPVAPDAVRLICAGEPRVVLEDDRVTERQFGMDAVEVAPSLAASLDVAGVLQVAQDAVGVAFRDSYSRREFPHAHVGTLSNSEQYLGVVRDERPLVCRCPEQLERRLSCLRHGNNHAEDSESLAQPATGPNLR